MKIIKRFKIRSKIAVGYGLAILFSLVSSIFGSYIISQSRMYYQRVADEHLGFMMTIEALDNLTVFSELYTKNWIFFPDSLEKFELDTIHLEEFPQLKEAIAGHTQGWYQGKEISDSIEWAVDRLEQILVHQKTVMNTLKSSSDYDSETIQEMALLYEDEIRPEAIELAEFLQHVNDILADSVENLEEEKIAFFNFGEQSMLILIGLAIFVGLAGTVLLSRSIVRRVKSLNKVIDEMSLGAIPKINIRGSFDEIDDMMHAMSKLASRMQAIEDVATEIENGNLDVSNDLLSEKDTLGQALLSMRQKLSQVIQETNEAVQMAGEQGKLNTRIPELGHKGAWLQLTESINSLIKSLATPIAEVNRIVNAMAQGDLTKKYEAKASGQIQELSNNFNGSLAALKSLMLEIEKRATIIGDFSGEMISTGQEMKVNTEEIVSAIAQMSNGSQNQQLKIEESSNFIEAILDSSIGMGEKSEKINSEAERGADNSAQGMDMVNSIVNDMSEISALSRNTHESINILTDRSKEISNVLSVITEIASQTNLLALNAAIEAAQAGEAGRGFAIIAEEIRKLADDSKNSTLEIENVIGAIKSDTQQTAQVISAMDQKVRAGVESANQTLDFFKEINSASTQTLRSSEEILEASENQSTIIKKVVTITEGVVVISEQTAAGTNEVASSAEELSVGMRNYAKKSMELSKIADHLKKGLSNFTLVNSRAAPDTPKD